MTEEEHGQDDEGAHRVEDDAAMRALLRDVLERAGYLVVERVDGEDGRLVHERPP